MEVEFCNILASEALRAGESKDKRLVENEIASSQRPEDSRAGDRRYLSKLGNGAKGIRPGYTDHCNTRFPPRTGEGKDRIHFI